MSDFNSGFFNPRTAVGLKLKHFTFVYFSTKLIPLYYIHAKQTNDVSQLINVAANTVTSGLGTNSSVHNYICL